MERNLSYTVSSLQRYVPWKMQNGFGLIVSLSMWIYLLGAVSDSLCNLCIAMARKGGLTPMWSDREVERWFDYFVDRAEERIYKLLQRAGEEFVKLARKKGNYQDHTGNLRSSIGYVIVKDGDILTENYELSDKKGTDKYTGLREAKRLVSELLPLYKNGWVLIGVAAMPYAKYVEAIENLDVISVATEHAEDWIKKQSRTLFDKLAEKGY